MKRSIYMRKICMIVQDPMVKGGISAVINGYRNSKLEQEFDITYVESYKNGGKITKIFKSIVGYFHFAKVLIINKPNLVHIHSSFGGSFYRKIPFIYMAKWFKVPIVNHCHGADFNSFYLAANIKKKKLIKMVYGKCDIILALSEEWKERFSLIVPSKKIMVVENYSIIHNEAVKIRNSRECNNQVLFLGEIGKRKGCYDIPEVVEKVIETIPNVRFILAGSGEIEQIEEILEEKGIEKNVFFPGWVRGNEKDKLMKESDIFFLPSYNEGMPMAILDAMGYGLPIISTNVGGIPKIVNDGENGYTFKPGDIEGFANSIVKILNNTELLYSYGRQSYLISSREYSLDKHINNIKLVYEKLINVR
jgi:glycosyltransferase involved in cell wall biosynthesis